MDFLPHPESGVEPLSVPFVADIPYDYGADFWAFPKLHGFDDDWRSLPPFKLAALIQSWLYFGTVAEVLEQKLDLQQFSASRQSLTGELEPFVYSKPLSPMLDQWLKSKILPVLCPAIEDLSSSSRSAADEMRAHLSKHERFLDRVVSVVAKLEQLPRAAPLGPLPVICLSVTVLCQTLAEAIKLLLQPNVRIQRERLSKNSYENKIYWSGDKTKCDSPSQQVLVEEMRRQGWCPAKIQRLKASNNQALQYYCSRLYRKSSQSNHDHCTHHACKAHNVDMSNYVTKHLAHLTPGHRCEHAFVDVERIQKIIEDGGIPIIRVVKSDGSAPLKLKVKRATLSTRFVAISHVWSDGMGNPTANSLPQCQLSRIQSYVDGLELPSNAHVFGYYRWKSVSIDWNRMTSLDHKARYFWLDTLCIPIGVSQDLKDRAINQMAAIYRNAFQMLVLDSSLQSIPCSTTDACEAFGRLALSPWMDRCWTFQEMKLATVWKVQCLDASIDPFAGFKMAPRNAESWLKWKSSSRPAFGIGAVIRKLVKLPITTLWFLKSRAILPDARGMMVAAMTHELISFIIQRTYGGTNEEAYTDGFYSAFLALWNHLSDRSTTQIQDIHVILANLLRLNSHTILELKQPEDRMAMILDSLSYIPLSLFFNHGTRYDSARAHDDRWLPLFPSEHKLQPFPRLHRVAGSLCLFPQFLDDQRGSSIHVLIWSGRAKLGNSLILRHESGHYIKVEIHRDAEDEMQISDQTLLGLVIDHDFDAETPTQRDNETQTRFTKIVPAALFFVTGIALPTSSDLPSFPSAIPHNQELEFKNSINQNYRWLSNQSVDFSSLIAKEQGILGLSFDCPVTAKVTDEATLAEDVPVVECNTLVLPTTSLPHAWVVLIKRGPRRTFVRLDQRLNPAGKVWLAITSYSFLFLLLSTSSIVSLSLTLAVCVQQFSFISSLAKTALLLKLCLHGGFCIQFLSSILLRYWDVPHLLLMVFYTVARLTRGPELSTLEKVFVCWGFVNHGILFFVRAVIFPLFLSFLWQVYVQDFEPDRWLRRLKNKLKIRLDRLFG